MTTRYPLAAIHYRNLSDLARITGYPLRTSTAGKPAASPATQPTDSPSASDFTRQHLDHLVRRLKPATPNGGNNDDA